MLMVIFGAGASYDSSPVHQVNPNNKIDCRPPLACDLFEARRDFLNAMQFFDRCQAIVPYLQNPGNGRTVEQELQRIQNEAEEDDDAETYSQLIAIRYYLQYMLANCQSRWANEYLRGISNYKTLLDQIRRSNNTRDPVCLVSFNYDTLLDDNLATVGVNINNNIFDYISHDTFKLIKPHGSINWGRELDGDYEDAIRRGTMGVVDEVMQHPRTLKISDRYCLVNRGPVTVKPESRTPLFPAIAIPVESKNQFECPPEHLDMVCKMLPQVDTILTVGWRATERSFLELLSQHLGRHVRVMVVAADEGSATINNIRKARINATFFDAGCGFSDFIVNRQADKFLRGSETYE